MESCGETMKIRGKNTTIFLSRRLLQITSPGMTYWSILAHSGKMNVQSAAVSIIRSSTRTSGPVDAPTLLWH